MYFFLAALVAAVLVFVIYRPRYARTMIPVSSKHADMHIVVDFTVRELVFFVNLMVDVEKECQKPFFMRLWWYRSNPDLNECHEIMLRKIVSRLELMKEFDEIMQREDTLPPDGE